MYVKMLRGVLTPAEHFRLGEVYEVPHPTAHRWIEEGKAKQTNHLPTPIRTLKARLALGADEPCLFLPPAGMEFGHEVMTHLRIVHFHQASFKVVCCRPGNQVLYPSANEFVTDWSDPVPDEYRVGTKQSSLVKWPKIEARFPSCVPIPAGGLSSEEALCCISPEKQIPFKPKLRGLQSDIVLGIRQRKFWTARNWKHWQCVADELTDERLTFSVIGTHETSQNLFNQLYHSGDYDTDAAVELLQNCRLYIGTDCGASHLAATVGVPMLLFREAESGTPDLIPRMQMVNPKTIEVVAAGWEDPSEVVSAAMQLLKI